MNIHDAKTNLSRYLEEVEKGEQVVICRRNEPIAEVRGIAQARKEPRPIGLAAGEFEVPDEFFEPLPDDVLKAFGAHS